MRTYESKMVAASLYRNGCIAKRLVQVELQEGRNEVGIYGLSSFANVDTLKMMFAEGVKGENIHMIYADEEDGVLQEIKDKIAALEREIKILRDTRELWLKNGVFAGSANIPVADMQAYLEALPEKIGAIDAKSEALEKERERLAKEHDGKAAQVIRPLVALDLVAKQAGSYQVSLEYNDGMACWNPLYEVCFKDEKTPLSFRIRANAVNRTDENWENVSLKLYTGNPSLSNDLPVLFPQCLRLENDAGNNKRFAMGRALMMKNEFAMAEEALDEADFSDTVQMKRVDVEANVSQDTMTEYALPGKKSVPSSGNGVLLDLQEFEINAKYSFAAVPRREAAAFLCAEIASDDIPVMMSGRASVYLGDAYAGTVALKPDMTEDSFILSLGRDERISVSRKTVKSRMSKALLKKERRKEIAHEIRVCSYREEEVRVVLRDQVPVSSDKSIVVEDILLDGGVLDEKTGEVAWTLDLKPREIKVIKLGYQVAWPRDKEIIGLAD